MELIFVYIEDYYAIKDRGFSFSSKFEITYDKTKSKITIANSAYSLSDKFHTNINDIKAVIGENGCGKSTLLRYLFDKGHTTIMNLNQQYSKDFIIYFKNDEFHIACCNQCPVFEIENSTSKKTQVRVSNFAEDFQWEKIIDFKNVGFIYFSNLFDNHQVESGLRDSINISTNHLLKIDKELYYNGTKEDGFQQIDCFRINEIKRQINFINNNTDIGLGFKIPKYLEVRPLERDQRRLYNFIKQFDEKAQNINNAAPEKENKKYTPDGFEEESNYYKELKQLTNKLQGFIETFKVNEVKENHFKIVINAVVCNYIIFIHENINVPSLNLVKEKTELLKLLSKGINNDNILLEEIIENVKSLEKELNSSLKMNIDGLFSKDLIFAHDFISIYEKIINTSEIIFSPLNIPTSNIFLKNWLDTYLLTKKGVDFLHFQWRDLSSGELARLNLFSRFYDALSKEITKNKESFIILIDEGDIFLHPNWQREFINTLNKYLAPLFGTKKIQIILTSHSPFVTSDLTKSHIYFFDPENPSNKVHEETFAQNIFTLFKDSFYLKSPIGEFAALIVQTTISRLKKADSLVPESGLKADILSIGEPFIKEKLLSLYYEKFPDEYQNELERRNRIKELKEELKRLEK